jgi:Tetrapyrrole (Corrin/Porphyrin) Methylases
MGSLPEFLARLSFDPARLSEFISSPTEVMRTEGLDERSQRALLSRSMSIMWDVLLNREVSAFESEFKSPEEETSAKRGSLTVVGTGIRTVGQLTSEAIAWIRVSDTVLYLIADPVAEEVIRHLNPRGAMSLRGYYGEGMPRTQSYEAMVQHITGCVKAGERTCVALYGHPGVFAYPSHESIRRLRLEGYAARMLPGISAEDCLFADLGVDPAVNGCQSFEASDFLLHERTIDTSSQLVLWQIGVVGDWTYRTTGYDLHAFPLLVTKLCNLYGQLHEAIVYEAAILPGLPPTITRIALVSLTPQYVNAGSTLYVPPSRLTTGDRATQTALGIRP